MKTVAIIGGGITGLTTLYYLEKMKREQNLSINLILIERNFYLGGKIHTISSGGFAIETGADSIVARHESVMPFLEELNLKNEITYNATGISFIYTNNELHPIPKDTIFGIPMSKESLLRSTLLSEEGKQEALKEPEKKNEQFTMDSSIGEFLEYFLGKELVEKQIAPVLSGVYSGKLEKLTLASTLPYLLEYKNQYGSIIKGLSIHKEKFQAGANKKFLSFRNGLSTLVNQIEAVVEDAVILKGINAVSVRQENSKYSISFSNHLPIEADFIVFATPEKVAKELLAHDELNKEFAKFKSSSLTSVYLGFAVSDSLLPADGTGFIVSGKSNVHCDACTWTSRKWSHTSKEGNLLVRLFYKSSNPTYDLIKQMNEQQVVEMALKDIANSMAISATPQVVEVTHWTDLMPNYHLDHHQAVNAVTEKIARTFPNVLLAGCSYYGVGIGACIKNGLETAEQIVSRVLKR